MGKTLWLIGLILVCVAIQGCGGGTSAITGVTLDLLEGTWDFMGSGAVRLGATQGAVNCAVSFAGTLIVTRDGSVRLARENHSSCSGDSSISNIPGGLTVGLEGRGTLDFPEIGEINTIQFSRSLNEAVFSSIRDPGIFISAVAFRR